VPYLKVGLRQFVPDPKEKTRRVSPIDAIASIKKAYDISATVGHYFLVSVEAPYCGQAQRACASSSNPSPASEHLFYPIRP
jgi:hypothetical protein